MALRIRLPLCGPRCIARVVVSCVCVALLGACAGNSQSAWELIQKQQEKQAMINHYEAEQARKNAPDEPHLMLSTIRQAQQQGRYFASLAYIDAYTKKYGRNSDIDALRADALRMTGQTADSKAAYQALLKTGNAAEGWHGLGLLAGAQGNFVLAAHDLEQAAQLAPVDANILNDLGYARLRAGDLAGARVPLGKAAELDPRNDKVISNLALLLLAKGNSTRAEQVMDKAGLSKQVRQQIHALARQIPAHPVALTNGSETPPVAVATPVGMATPTDIAASPTTVATNSAASQSGDVVRNVSAATGNVSATTVSSAIDRPATPASSASAYGDDNIAFPVLQPRVEQRFGNPYVTPQGSN